MPKQAGIITYHLIDGASLENQAQNMVMLATVKAAFKPEIITPGTMH